MAKARYEYCEAADIRACIGPELNRLPPSNNKKETPAGFWLRIEQAGLLLEALARYDELAAELTAWKHTRRETKKEFENRIEREGRQAEAERVRADLVAAGLNQREAQAELVQRFQPLDGSKTRAWETPDPWLAGRLFRDKADQQNVLTKAGSKEAEDDNEYVVARERFYWAKLRREERQALANARQRAKALKLEHKKPKSQAGQAPSPAPGTSGRRDGQDRMVI
jgi:hypothetical protein